MQMTMSCCILAAILVAACLSFSYAQGPLQACPNLMEDLSACQAHLGAVSDVEDRSAVCQAGRAYIVCVEHLKDRCDLDMQELEDSLDNMRDLLESQFHCQLAESSSENAPGPLDAEEAEESADKRAAIECPPSQAAFLNRTAGCMDVENMTPSNFCRLLRDAITCVEGLAQACENSEWMTPEFIQYIKKNMDDARSLLRLRGCSHG